MVIDDPAVAPRYAPVATPTPLVPRYTGCVPVMFVIVTDCLPVLAATISVAAAGEIEDAAWLVAILGAPTDREYTGSVELPAA
ncbi:hypothetical protein [Sphingobium sp. HDIP04]|uniref:hypothetical protein n=1 Tax=Sphingobium sp. HDIP04 TaxID=428994 RepID=UPI000387A46D|nr:hypothetical protein [Sphingobium sp. HDIP04]EQB03909.1 hypothetical protein L286_11130 [Sphingobium sp. HDIP04]